MLTDHNDTIPDYVIDAIPGARELTDAIDAAEADLRAAREKARTTGDRLRALSSGDGPGRGVKTTDYHRALDASREAGAVVRDAETALRRAKIARFDHVCEGMAAPEFREQIDPLMATAVAKAKDAVAGLRAAITERDELAFVLGRQVQIPHGWYGLAGALRDVDAYIGAVTVDEDEAAWTVIIDGISGSTAPAETRAKVVDAAQAVRASDAPSSEKRRQYRAILSSYGLGLRA